MTNGGKMSPSVTSSLSTSLKGLSVDDSQTQSYS